jgi:hypothetical protein
MLPHASLHAVLDALLLLNKSGFIKRRSDAGIALLNAENIKVCPRGPRETVFSYARWTDTSTR